MNKDKQLHDAAEITLPLGYELSECLSSWCKNMVVVPHKFKAFGGYCHVCRLERLESFADLNNEREPEYDDETGVYL